jgi:crossover junction endodeoxyribonuclease RuvC
MKSIINYKPMRILGLDLGLARLGYGIIDFITYFLKYITHGCLFTSSKQPISSRLNIIYEDLINLIFYYQPDIIILEKVFHTNNTKTINVINQVHGIILLLIEQLNLPVFEYTPIQVKQSILLTSKAKKTEVIKRIQLLFKLQKNIGCQIDDAFDGLACAQTHIYNIKKILLFC